MRKQTMTKKGGFHSYFLMILLAVAFTALTNELSVPTAPSVEGSSAPVEVDPLPQDEDLFFASYYSRLTEKEQAAYNVIFQEVQSGRNTFLVGNLDREDYFETCWRALQAVTYDHPELFWLQCYICIDGVYDWDTQTVARVNLKNYEYWNYVSDKEEKKEALTEAVTAVAAEAAAYPNHYERIKFVHDYLVENAIYDHDALEEAKKTIHDPAAMYIYSAYGCLVDGRTVCAGFAKAFQLIMNELGYGCMYVVGDAGGAHAWNCVFVEGEGYYVDVTWDNPDRICEEPMYPYFCISDDLIARTHTIDDTFDLPACTAEQYNYYKYNGFLLESYSLEAVCAIAEKQLGGHTVTMQFTSEEEWEKARADFLEKGKWNRLPNFKKDSLIRYSMDTSQFTLTLYSEDCKSYQE